MKYLKVVLNDSLRPDDWRLVEEDSDKVHPVLTTPLPIEANADAVEVVYGKGIAGQLRAIQKGIPQIPPLTRESVTKAWQTRDGRK